jgi:cephalosporin hydroxylase
MKKVPSLLIAMSLAFGSSALYVPEASSQVGQVGKVIMRSMDDVIRAISKGAPRVARRYRMTNAVKIGPSAFVTTVTFGNTAYQVSVDCKNGRASRSLYNLPPEQRVSLVRDICAGQFQ